MAKIIPYVLLACLLIITTNATAASFDSSKTATYTNFIKTSCSTTTYPSLCNEYLSSYASKVKSNPWKLCNTALRVSMEAAKKTSSLAKKLYKSRGLTKIETAVLKDCIENIGNSIDELKKSVKAMGNMKMGSSSSSLDVEFQMSNVKSWVSAAITDENTCTDEFDEEKVSKNVKNQIRSSVVKVAKITSNALSLVNKLKY